MSSILRRKKLIFWVAVAIALLWLSRDLLHEFFAASAALWSWRPETVIGLAMIATPILLVYPANYFLNVRRTSSGGATKVYSFLDYLGHGVLNMLTQWALGGSIIAGIFILLFGWEIR